MSCQKVTEAVSAPSQPQSYKTSAPAATDGNPNVKEYGFKPRRSLLCSDRSVPFMHTPGLESERGGWLQLWEAHRSPAGGWVGVLGPASSQQENRPGGQRGFLPACRLSVLLEDVGSSLFLFPVPPTETNRGVPIQHTVISTVFGLPRKCPLRLTLRNTDRARSACSPPRSSSHLLKTSQSEIRP